jgi:hypothetical protein
MPSFCITLYLTSEGKAFNMLATSQRLEALRRNLFRVFFSRYVFTVNVLKARQGNLFGETIRFFLLLGGREKMGGVSQVRLIMRPHKEEKIYT